MFTTTPPRAATTLTLGAALALSTIPSLLPRGPFSQGLLTGGLILISLSVLALWRLLARRLGAGPHRRPTTDSPRARWLLLAGTATGVAGIAWWAQVALGPWAAGLAMAVPGPTYWLTSAAWALVVVGAGLGAVRLVRWAARSPWRRSPLPLAAALLAGTTVTVGAAGAVDLLQPLRKDLGAEHVMLAESPLGGTRSFALVGEAPTPEAGAALAVERMVAAGGLDREAIVIALPTGSGWVNGAAVTAFEGQLDGDVAVVSAQYGDLPSWWSFLLDRDPAMQSAQALVDQVLERVSRLPVDQRPDVYLHGESLGALAGQAALAGVPQDAVCGALWSGAPGGEVRGHPRERSLQNADDPVVHLSAETILAQPEQWPTAWLPGLSYGTTLLDLTASLAPSHGHGHRYGPEQDWSLPTC